VAQKLQYSFTWITETSVFKGESMSNENDEYFAYITHMRDEHTRLREFVQDIEQRWVLAHQRAGAANVIPQVIESLETLRAELAHHFEEEESGACLEEAVVHRPSLSHEATRLEQEHPELLREADRLIEELRAKSQSGESADNVKQKFRVFAEQLHAHEAAENRILEESFGIECE
jgi:hypothetical protein